MGRRCVTPPAWRLALVGAVLVVSCGACGSGSSTQGARSASEYRGPPTGTLPSLVAPPRSYRPQFEGEAASVEVAFRSRMDAFARGDVAAVLSRTRDGTTTSTDVQRFIDNYDVRLFRILGVAVHGDRATVDYEDAIVGRDVDAGVTTLLHQHEVWRRSAGDWLWTSDVATAPGIPDDVSTVTVTLREGQPIIVPSDLPGGEFAFLVENTAGRSRGLFLLGVPADLDVPSFLPTVEAVTTKRGEGLPSPFPAGVLELGATPAIAPGSRGTITFSGRLPAGRYLILATDGPEGPVLRDEIADFTLPSRSRSAVAEVGNR